MQCGEVGALDVETHVAAGELGLCRSSGKAGMEEQLAEIALGEAIGGFGRNETAFECALLHALVIDAAAVVFDFDVDVIAAMISAEGDFAGFGLASGAAHIGGLDSM